MEVRRQKHVPLACRYVPYDQWFLTHVDPSWKIKHLKQLILAKCFMLPFDPRHLGGGVKDADGPRAPSPITFAPDEGHRPISPIKFANPLELKKKRSAPTNSSGVKDDESTAGHEEGAEEAGELDQGQEAGYEEDDEWDEDEDDEGDDEEEEEPAVIPGGKVGFSAGGLAGPSGRVGGFQPPATNTQHEPQTPVYEDGGTSKRKRRFNPLSKIGARDRQQSKSNMAQERRPKEEEEGIQTSWFTLLRFATGQVLEEDFPISWYDLMPHELVELHNCVPPANFAVSSALGQLLVQTPALDAPTRPHHAHSMSHSAALVVKSGVITTSVDAASALASALLIPTTNPSSSLPGAVQLFQPHTPHPLTQQSLFQAQLALMASEPRRLTPLPRSEPTAYVQPYWEGWVRALRTVKRADPVAVGMRESGLVPGAGRRYDYVENSGGMGGGGGVGLVPWEMAFGGIEGGPMGGERVRVKAIEGKIRDGDGLHRDGKDRAHQEGWREIRDRERGYESMQHYRERTTLEWRERWVVVKDGYLHLFKERGDTTSTHQIPFSNLVNLMGAEHLADSIHNHRRSHRTHSSDRHRRTKSTGRPAHEHHRRSASQPRAGASAHHARETPRKGGTSSNHAPIAMSRSRTSAGIDEISERERHLPRPPGLGSPPPSFERRSQGSGHHHHQKPPPRPLTDAELRAAKERDAKREQERIKEAERKRRAEAIERELDSIQNWDDISFFGRSKKDKEKEKSKGKEKAKDEARRKDGLEARAKEDEERQHKEKERDRKDREREREKAKERERRKREYERQRGKEHGLARKDDISYIPTSREEAEAAGMKVICAKFLTSRGSDPKGDDKPPEREAANAPPRKYTSTGPSLAGTLSQPVAEDDITGGALKEKLAEESGHGHGSGHAHSQSLAPRKASLPGLGLSVAKAAPTTALPAPSSTATGLPSSVGKSEIIPTSSSSKFGIGGLFGKDKEGAEEREEKKREEKEKKAREKELKQIEKDRKKGKRREDDDEEDNTIGSSLSWKMGKKAKPGSGAPHEIQLQPKLQSATSLWTADTSTLQDTDNDFSTTASATTVGRPKLTISPGVTQNATNNDTASKAQDSDTDSTLSMSSPVFAHSADSEDSYDEDYTYGYGKPRQGYRYGGYHPSPAKIGQASNVKAVAGETDGSKTETGHSQPLNVIGSTSNAAEMGISKAEEKDSRPPRHRPREKERRKEKGEEHGEWLVLDLGSDQAFHSFLRVIHRQFLNPLSSGFLPPTLSAPPSNSRIHASKPSSPIQRTFWSASSSALNRPMDNSEGSTSESRSSGANPSNTLDTVSHAEEDIDDMYVSTTAEASQQSYQPSHQHTAHPTMLTALVGLPSQTAAVKAPALPYPEWRTEVVHRARRYGMREAGRPLELALYGWGRYFTDMGTSAAYQKLRKREDASRQKVRASIAASSASLKSPGVQQSWEGDISDDDVEVEQEGEDTPADSTLSKVGPDSSRRMSTVSRVSTIKAPVAKSEQLARHPVIHSIDDQDTDPKEGASADADSGTERGSDDADDADSMTSRQDDDYEGGYAYGLDDEEGALAEGLGSIMGDSEEESEVEWVAWSTDLPRQYEVYRQQKELDRLEKLKAQEEDEFQDPESQPLSPMEFSNPFAADNASFISQNITLPTVLPPIPPPKTPEEERRQYAENRRKLEPSAVSTSLPPPLPLLPTTPRLASVNSASMHQATSSTSSTQSILSSRGNAGYNSQRSALSSPSSSESLGRARAPLARAPTSAIPINVGLANTSSRNHSNPISPLGGGFSPIDDELEPSSSPLRSALGYTYDLPAHRRTHSRSISGTTPDNHDHTSDTPSLLPGRSTLHHSSSMPLTGSVSQPMFAASPPHSPTRSSAAKGASQPIAMAILTPAQISQIESDMEEEMLRDNRLRPSQSETTSLAPSPSISPPSIYGYHTPREPSTAYATMPQRSSSAGFAPSSPPLPSSAVPAGTIERSVSVQRKPLPPHPVDQLPERGLLRKKRSGLGKSLGGNETARDGEFGSPSAKQRPALSLLGLSGSSSKTTAQLAEAQSPTPQQHPRGPRSAHPQSQDHAQGASPVPVSSSYSARALLRRVRSSSSLRMETSRIEEASPRAEGNYQAWVPGSTPPSGVIVQISSTTQGKSSGSRPRDASPPAKKKVGAMDRLVRGLDSAFEFVDGR